jgi:hypothetical protein
MMVRRLAQSREIALGGFYRRWPARRGVLLANIALARKLAQLFCHVMVEGINHSEAGLKPYEAKVLATKHRALSQPQGDVAQQPVVTGIPGKLFSLFDLEDLRVRVLDAWTVNALSQV